jgi:hypothetical protein
MRDEDLKAREKYILGQPATMGVGANMEAFVT